ncbi:bifunctional DNA-formamidopyrimidine glycosylase/DNA-(apurinic or apyrimidinic site) lyase [Algicella marina]|uniref:Formamidopyrimidine-DNA glycosylase n=1 Tax=Algicella marina TaxID=2683284 RepID=A0A6P1T147_9RHOB|nr:bifunctional DNA-formamidopyrimidine glycosylase/DNA-(apurinic or apyrimidinic site) lyase [Algicella marina]QHQ36634.1 bifunctional DNA-formamidopyrimidine glycosylase/DNA-(apurinic or apyrimidinic site) lyase [Algicella marina]
MPELPEVETVRRGLKPAMEGQSIARTEVRRPDLRWRFPDRMAERLSGVRVNNLRRRSKVLILDLDSRESLLVHLGMSGRMLIEGEMPGGFHLPQSAPGKHDHVIFNMESGTRITFNDPRRFGAMDLWPTFALDKHRFFRKLGPEPLSNNFNGPYLVERLQGKKAPIKAALLDQRIVCGLGNIYVCEALWRSGIAPTLPAGDVTEDRLEALIGHIRTTLEEAIEAGGSSLKDYRKADGELGYFQHSFAVYGREGEPCQRKGCAGSIDRIAQSGRSTFCCLTCQT